LHIEDDDDNDVDKVYRDERFRLSPGKQPWRRLLGRPGHRWENNVTMDFKEKGWEDVDLIQVFQDKDHWS